MFNARLPVNLICIPPKIVEPLRHQDSKPNPFVWCAVCSSRGTDICLQPLPQGCQPAEDAHPAVPHTSTDAAGEAAISSHSPQVQHAHLRHHHRGNLTEV